MSRREAKIVVEMSPTADTRTCDVTQVSKDALRESSRMHIDDVINGMEYIAQRIKSAAFLHDHTKMTKLDAFYTDFKNNFKTTDWYEDHVRAERHHLQHPNGVPEDVNLIDVIECLVDGVMAGMARSGKYISNPPSVDVLLAAYENTAKLLIDNIKLEE